MNEDPDGDGIKVTNNFRFPGQYFDAETGANYNYFRTYIPAFGRYTQHDPIGLNGGMNPFGYVLGDPVSFIDVNGLSPSAPFNPDPNVRPPSDMIGINPGTYGTGAGMPLYALGPLPIPGTIAPLPNLPPPDFFVPPSEDKDGNSQTAAPRGGSPCE